MRKILLSIVLLFAAISSIFAQKLTVESFNLASSDLTAQTQPRKDLNDRNCALIKVGLGLQGVQFEGSIVGNVENKTGEYWVYMPQGNRMLKVKHANYAPVMVTFADYDVEKVESNRTYELVVTASGKVQTQQMQNLNIRYSPTNATVLVDNKPIKSSNGMAVASLPIGQHSFLIFCDGYESEEGMVKLKATAPSNLQVTLSKGMSYSDNIGQMASTTTIPVNLQNTMVIPVKDGQTIEMVKVKGGSFTMGTSAGTEEGSDWEKPQHKVTITRNYLIGKYEVTQALWQAVMGENPSRFKGEELPVENVSWNDCKEFIYRLNAITGKNFRLPTEAEWEYAARGGNESQHYKYSGSDKLPDVAWYGDNSNERTHPVGTKRPNELGIYDMTGNVVEWCEDDSRTYQYDSQVNPIGPLNTSFRVFRGGAWTYRDGYGCSNSSRAHRAKDNRSEDFGLRLAMSE